MELGSLLLASHSNYSHTFQYTSLKKLVLEKANMLPTSPDSYIGMMIQILCLSVHFVASYPVPVTPEAGTSSR